MSEADKGSFPTFSRILIIFLVVAAFAAVFSLFFAIYLNVKRNYPRKQANVNIVKETNELIFRIDPEEQLKKGEDTQRRNAVLELRDALVNYFSSNKKAPWCTDNSECKSQIPGISLNDPLMSSVLEKLIKSGDLKPDFSDRISKYFGEIFITSSQQDLSLIICFKPKSEGFRADKNTIYTKTGELPCTASDCYWCAR